jgi:hypothetical protein
MNTCIVKNLKKFIGERAYNIIKNITVDADAIRRALITPQNARAVFADLTEFEIKSLCTEISNSGIIGKVRETTREEIIKAFNSAGYDKVIFDDEVAISECRKYYKQGEVICTYNDLQSRMNEYHMLVAIKANIDNIERAENPQREDEYGTSVLNIQIAKNGSHMSIKNRYNHTVSQPDSTLNNNLDMLYMGLQSMVLGYYGFASLSSTKSNYKNIINIGGVYLKYHTERNNIYFGSFVLDGVKGARFTDTSRYYITAGQSNDRYYNEPIVLDFKEKKAIDIAIIHSTEQPNGRTPLLTKAMQEGILSSANKQEADTLTAVFQDANRELLQSRKKALTYIHEVYGYDFTKPYKVTGFLGKFTAKSIEKATGSDTGILLVYSKREMRVCEVNYGKFCATGLHRNSKYGIDTFCRQCDFEEWRKSGITAVYFIQQEKQYIRKPKREEGRIYYGNRDNGKHEFDKSGCNLTEVRFKLLQRLNKYKTDKRAKEAQEIDYTQYIVEITKSFNELKMRLVTLLTNAETSEEYDKINDVMSYKLVWLVRDIENIKKHAKKKSFSSVDSAISKINSVKATITEFKSKL